MVSYLCEFFQLTGQVDVVVEDIANGAVDLGSIPGPVKSDTISSNGSPPLRCFFGAVQPRR